MDDRSMLLTQLLLENAADEADYVTGWAVEVVDPDGMTRQLHGPHPLDRCRGMVTRLHRELNVDDPRPDPFTFHIRPLYDFDGDAD